MPLWKKILYFRAYLSIFLLALFLGFSFYFKSLGPQRYRSLASIDQSVDAFPMGEAGPRQLWTLLPMELQAKIGAQILFRHDEYRQIEFIDKKNLYASYLLEYAPKPFKNLSRRYVLSADKVLAGKILNDDEKYCWNLIASGGYFCTGVKSFIQRQSQIKARDPLISAREISYRFGFRAGRDYLLGQIPLWDQSSGQMEKRLEMALGNEHLSFTDSFASLPKQEKEKIRILVLYGFAHHISPYAKVLVHIAEVVKKMGFKSELVWTHPLKNSIYNGETLQEKLEEYAKQPEKILIVAPSKGVADLINCLYGPGLGLSQEAISKIVGVVSLSGVIRGSFFSRWAMQSDEWTAYAMKAIFYYKGGDQYRTLEGLESLGENPWPRFVREKIQEASRIPFLNFVAVPDTETGLPFVDNDAKVKLMHKHAVAFAGKDVGPSDSLIESAAAMFPPETPIKSAVVRVLGVHGLIGDGSLINGQVFSKDPSNPDEFRDGEFLMNAILRSMPSDFNKVFQRQ